MKRHFRLERDAGVEVELCVFKLNVLAGSSFDETASSLIIARTSGAVLFSRAVSCFYNRRLRGFYHHSPNKKG